MSLVTATLATYETLAPLSSQHGQKYLPVPHPYCASTLLSFRLSLDRKEEEDEGGGMGRRKEGGGEGEQKWEVEGSRYGIEGKMKEKEDDKKGSECMGKGGGRS